MLKVKSDQYEIITLRMFTKLDLFRGRDSFNLVPRAHVPFGEHQDTELWNNQFPETKILGLPVSRRMRGLVYMASRDRGDKVDVDTFLKEHSIRTGKTTKVTKVEIWV